MSPVSSERFAATEKSGPRFVALTAVQTVTAPTITVHGRDRKPSPSKPSSSRDHANRKGDKKDDKKDKKKDDDGGKDKDEGPPEPNPTEKSGGGEKDPDDSDDSGGSKDSVPTPPPSEPEEVEDWGERSGKGRRRDHRVQQGKEAEDVKFLAFPQGSQWRAWRARCVQTVIAAAGRHDDEAFPWIQACATESPEDLCIPGEGWVSLDRKIAAGLMRICHGELGRELTQMSTAMYNDNQFVRGRSLWALVFRYYASGNSGQVLYDLNHLQGLKMVGDNIEGFHNTWNMVMSELASRPAEDTLQLADYHQIKGL